ncbi:MAG TPA: PIN domain-containing protein [Terriglobia bacterium]|nr:PIN domain-containing protein [Terriglobia bacterium]
MNALVDTSVWSLLLRRKPNHLNAAEGAVVAELAELIREGRARIIGVVRQELLSGIKTLSRYEKLRAALRAFPDEPIETSDYEGAARAANECRSSGIAVSPVDMLICEISLARHWTIFTTDPDFNNYAKVLPIRLHAARR